MCNLSHNIETKGTAKNLVALMKNANVSLLEAMEMLGIDQSEYEMYEDLIKQLQSENNE